jgi:hypothetical protein
LSEDQTTAEPAQYKQFKHPFLLVAGFIFSLLYFSMPQNRFNSNFVKTIIFTPHV